MIQFIHPMILILKLILQHKKISISGEILGKYDMNCNPKTNQKSFQIIKETGIQGRRFIQKDINFRESKNQPENLPDYQSDRHLGEKIYSEGHKLQESIHIQKR